MAVITIVSVTGGEVSKIVFVLGVGVTTTVSTAVPPPVSVEPELSPLPSIGTTEYVARGANHSDDVPLRAMKGNAEEESSTETRTKQINKFRCILVNTSRDLLEMVEGRENLHRTA